MSDAVSKLDDEFTDEFTFAMGDFEASFPRSYRYAKNHMWATPSPDQSTGNADQTVWRFGLTAYAVRLLQDVYFLDCIADVGTTLTNRKTIGSIESKKAESDLYSPIEGTLTAINADVLDEPSIINASPYIDGWMIEITGSANDDHLITDVAYAEHLIEAWDVAQRTIKGQANH